MNVSSHGSFGLRRRSLLALLAVLACAALALFFVRVEWIEQEVDMGYASEALGNPFLAAERFLQRHGVQTEIAEGLSLLDELPPSSDLILISSSREAMSRRRRDALREWVGFGGALVVVASEPWDPEQESSRDPLLDAFGVRLVEPEEESESDPEEVPAGDPGDDSSAHGADSGAAAPAAEPSADASRPLPGTLDDGAPRTVQELLEQTAARSGSACEVRDTFTTPLELPTGEELRVGLWGWRQLRVADPEGFVSGGESPGQFAQVSHGTGRLTVTTSLRIFTNPQIACFDHAFLLWFLSGGQRKVWIVHDPDVPALATLLARAFPITLLGGGLWLAAWLGAASLRFGVTQRARETPRRELLEHLEASAHFIWRHQSLRPLLERLRGEVRRKNPQAEIRIPTHVGRSELVQVARELLEERRIR